VILLHGWGGDKNSLKNIGDALKGEFRVTLVDLPGFGGTPHPKYPLKLEDYVNAVVDLINFYKMSGVVLIGHSFGGRVALLLAARYGRLLDGIVLIDSAGLKPRRGVKYFLKARLTKLEKSSKSKPRRRALPIIKNFRGR
jgi:Predicted hydrolases or acyltransferases (alpha/beta hydrolase superfamily)